VGGGDDEAVTAPLKLRPDFRDSEKDGFVDTIEVASFQPPLRFADETGQQRNLSEAIRSVEDDGGLLQPSVECERRFRVGFGYPREARDRPVQRSFDPLPFSGLSAPFNLQSFSKKGPTASLRQVRSDGCVCDGLSEVRTVYRYGKTLISRIRALKG